MSYNYNFRSQSRNRSYSNENRYSSKRRNNDSYEKNYYNQKEKKLRWKNDNRLIERIFFRKDLNPTNSLNERDVYDNCEKILRENYNRNLKKAQYNTNYDETSIIDKKKEFKWEMPRLINIPNKLNYNINKNVETPEYINFNNRNYKKISVIYSRDYQIPNSPKINLINNNSNIELIHLIKFDIPEIYNEKILKEKQIDDFEEIFDKKRTQDCYDRLKMPKNSLLKLKQLDKNESVGLNLEFNLDFNYLKSFLILLGIKTENYDNYIEHVKVLFFKYNLNNNVNIKQNLNTLKNLIEIYLRFKIQPDKGKIKTILPVSYKSTMMNNPDISVLKNENGINNQATFQARSMILGDKQNKKRKIVPCRWFHSSAGCERGDDCDFIHDINFKGVETPNMNKYVRPIENLSHNPQMNFINKMKYSQNNPIQRNVNQVISSNYNPSLIQNNNYNLSNSNSINHDTNKKVENVLKNFIKDRQKSYSKNN